MKKIWLISLVLISTISLGWADDFLITTENINLVKKIDQISKVKFSRGRIRVVTLKEGIAFSSLDQLLKNSLRKIDLKDISSNIILDRDEPIPEIKAVVDQVSAGNIEKTIKHLNSYRSRMINAEGNIEATQWIKKEFIKLGLETELHCFRTDVCNIIGMKSGAENQKAILLIGHMDTVGRSFAGADDNASGVAGVLEMARLLVPLNLKTPLIFIAANGEERGLLGSRAHVAKLKSDQQLASVSHVINMDMIGFNNGGNILDIETDNKFIEFGNFMGKVAATYSELTPRVSSPAWGSDHVPYIKANIPAVLTIEDWSNHNPCYHRSCDTIEKVDLNYAKNVVKVNLATVLLKNRDF